MICCDVGLGGESERRARAGELCGVGRQVGEEGEEERGKRPNAHAHTEKRETDADHTRTLASFAQTTEEGEERAQAQVEEQHEQQQRGGRERRGRRREEGKEGEEEQAQDPGLLHVSKRRAGPRRLQHCPLGQVQRDWRRGTLGGARKKKTHSLCADFYFYFFLSQTRTKSIERSPSK